MTRDFRQLGAGGNKSPLAKEELKEGKEQREALRVQVFTVLLHFSPAAT